MAAAEPAAEELAPIVWEGLLRPLVKVAAWFVVWGLSAIAFYIVKALFATADDNIGWIPWAGHWITGKLHTIEARLTGTLGDYMRGADKHMGLALHATAELVDQLADTQQTVAVNLWHMAGKLATLWGNAATGGKFKQAHTATKHAQATASSAVNTATHAQQLAIAASRPASVARIDGIAGEIDHVIEWDLPRIRDRAEAAQDSLDRLWKRVRSEKLVIGAGVITGAVAFALSKLGLGWTRCSYVKRLGKSVCGMNPNLLESLIAGSLVVAGSISIVELAKECQQFEGTAEAGLRFFVRELK